MVLHFNFPFVIHIYSSFLVSIASFNIYFLTSFYYWVQTHSHNLAEGSGINTTELLTALLQVPEYVDELSFLSQKGGHRMLQMHLVGSSPGYETLQPEEVGRNTFRYTL